MDNFQEKLNGITERVLSKALTKEEETNYTESLFESIKHINEYGQEFWYARELQMALEYAKWGNFKKVIEKAITTCSNSENDVLDHFADISKMVSIGSGAEREVEDYKLSRYLLTIYKNEQFINNLPHLLTFCEISAYTIDNRSPHTSQRCVQ